MPVRRLWQAAAPVAAQLLVAAPPTAQRSLQAAWLHRSPSLSTLHAQVRGSQTCST